MSLKTVYDSLLSIKLNELRTPYQLSQLILQLPEYKKHVLSEQHQQIQHDNDIDDDLMICQKLAFFIYKEQMNGKYLTNTNFNKQDFDNMMHLIHDKQYDSEWIWNIIVTLQNNVDSNNSNKINKLQWIKTLWSKRQLIINEANQYNQSKDIINGMTDNISRLSVDNPLNECKKNDYIQKPENCCNNDMDLWIRKKWEIKSKVEIYSKSFDSWITGTVVNKFNDEEGEWLEIQYIVGKEKRYRSKQTPRDDIDTIRPFSKAMPIYEYIYNSLTN